MRKQKGAAMIEFAIVLPFLLLLTVGIVEFSNVLMNFNTLNKATMDAARYLTVYARQSGGGYSITALDANNQSLLNQATNLVTCGKISACGSYSILKLPLIDLSQSTINTTTGMITVTATYDYPSIFGTIFRTNINLNGRRLTSTIVAQAL